MPLAGNISAPALARVQPPKRARSAKAWHVQVLTRRAKTFPDHSWAHLGGLDLTEEGLAEVPTGLAGKAPKSRLLETFGGVLGRSCSRINNV